MNTSNENGLYSFLVDNYGFNMPENQFMQIMQDPNSRESFRQHIASEYGFKANSQQFDQLLGVTATPKEHMQAGMQRAEAAKRQAEQDQLNDPEMQKRYEEYLKREHPQEYQRYMSQNPKKEETPEMDSYGRDLFEGTMAGIGSVALLPYRAVGAFEDWGSGIMSKATFGLIKPYNGNGPMRKFMNDYLGGDYFRTQTEYYRDEADRYKDNKGIVTSIKEGEFKKALGKAGIGVVENAPNLGISIALAWMGQPELAARTLAGGAAFETWEEVSKEKGLSDEDKAVAVLGTFLAEYVFEYLGDVRYQKMLSGKGTAEVVKSVAKEANSAWKRFAGSKMMQGLGSIWNRIMKRGGEAITEMATEIAEQGVDMYLGRRDALDWDAVGDAGLIAAISDAPMQTYSGIRDTYGKKKIQQDIEGDERMKALAAEHGATPEKMADIIMRSMHGEQITEQENNAYQGYMQDVRRVQNSRRNMQQLMSDAHIHESNGEYRNGQLIFLEAVRELELQLEDVRDILSNNYEEETDDKGKVIWSIGRSKEDERTLNKLKKQMESVQNRLDDGSLSVETLIYNNLMPAEKESPVDISSEVTPTNAEKQPEVEQGLTIDLTQSSQSEVPSGKIEGDIPTDKQIDTSKPVAIDQIVTVNINGEPKRIRIKCRKGYLNPDGTINFEKTPAGNVSYYEVFNKDIEDKTEGKETVIYDSNIRKSLQELVNQAILGEKQAADEAAKKAEEERLAAEAAAQNAGEQTGAAEQENPASQTAEETPEEYDAQRRAEEERLAAEEANKKPYPTKPDGSPDFAQIGNDPTMTVAAAQDMGLNVENVIAAGIKRIEDAIKKIEKDPSLTILEQQSQMQDLENQKAEWETLAQQLQQPAPVNETPAAEAQEPSVEQPVTQEPAVEQLVEEEQEEPDVLEEEPEEDKIDIEDLLNPEPEPTGVGEEGYPGNDILEDDVVVISRARGVYKLARKVGDKYVELNTDKPLKGAWKEVEKKVVYVGDKAYVLLTSTKWGTLKNNGRYGYDNDGNITAVDSETGAIVKLDRTKVTRKNEKGNMVPLWVDPALKQRFNDLKKNAKTLDDVLDYVVYSYNKDGERVNITLRDIIARASKLNDENVRISDKRLVNQMIDQILVDSGKDKRDNDLRSEVAKDISSFIGDAIRVWNGMKDRAKEDKVKGGKKLSYLVSQWLELIDKQGGYGKHVTNVLNAAAIRSTVLQEKLQNEGLTDDEQAELDALLGKKKEPAEAAPTDETDNTPRKELTPLQQMEKRHATLMQMWEELRQDKSKQEQADMVLQQMNELGAEIRKMRDSGVEMQMGEESGKPSFLRRLAGRRMVSILEKAGIKTNIISESEISQYMSDEQYTQLQDTKGVVYGFARNGEVYIVEERMNPGTPLHEYTHLWVEGFAQENPQRWKEIVETLKKDKVWQEVASDERYNNIHDNEHEMASEVLSRLVGEYFGDTDAFGRTRLEDSLESKTYIAKLRSKIRQFIKWVAGKLGKDLNFKDKNIEQKMRDILNMPIEDLLKESDELLEGGYTDEMRQIKERAIADGTFMKAPNGKPTNLTEFQWLQTRTKAFKDWFGDWEKMFRINKLRNSESASITGKEFEAPQNDFKTAKANAKEYAKILQGYYINSDTGDRIQLQRGRRNGGINEVLQHNYKDTPHILSVAAIPQIIEKSIFIENKENTDKETNPNVVSFDHYVCGLKIGEEDYTVHALVAIDKQGNRYYDHNLLQIEKTRLLDEIQQATSAEDFSAMLNTKSTIFDSKRKGTKIFPILKIKSSKIVDSNGEPSILYHGTGNFGFNIFDLSHSTSGEGIFFSGTRSGAKGYAGVMADLLRIGEKSQKYTADDVIKVFDENLNDKDLASIAGYVGNAEVEIDGNRVTLSPHTGGDYIGVEIGTPEYRQQILDWIKRNIDEHYLYRSGMNSDSNGIYAVYLNARNVLEIDAKGEDWDKIPTGSIEGYPQNNEYTDSNEISEWAKAQGYDGVIIRNVWDSEMKDMGVFSNDSFDEYISLTDKGNIKSAIENNGKFDKKNPDIRFQIGSPDPSDISDKVREQMEKKAERVKQTEPSMATKPAQRLDGIARIIYENQDNTYGLHLLQEKINLWRKEHGKEPIPESQDARSLLVRMGSATDKQIKWFKTHEMAHLNEVAEKLSKKIAASNLMQQFKEDQMVEEEADGTKFHYEPTAEDLLERYLIARDNIERAELKEAGNDIAPRGEEEFTARMGMSMVEYVELFQNTFSEAEINELWDAVRSCTHKSLEVLHDSQRISDEAYERMMSRQFYVPEKDFAERNTNQELGEQKKEEQPMRRGSRKKLAASAVAYKAKGGDTMATNILANIDHDVQNSIVVSEENKVRRAMYDMMVDNQDYVEEYGLPRPQQEWYVKVGEDSEGNPIYERSIEQPSAEDIEEAKMAEGVIKDVNAAIKDLREELKKHKKGTPEYDVIRDRISDAQNYIKEIRNSMPYVSPRYAKPTSIIQDKRKDVPSVEVYVNGNKYVMTFNGMKEVADALNGERDLRGTMENYKKLNAIVASLFTTYNPTFFAVNIARDVPYILLKGGSEYGPLFMTKFIKQFFGAGDTKLREPIYQYLYNGDINTTTPDGKMFYDFIMGGGSTGYTQLQAVDEIREQMKKKGGAIRQTAELFAKFNEYSELLTRFAAYKAMIELGHSNHEALNAAKNLSTNFNMKGAGNTFINFFNSLSMFSNAAIQGAAGFYKTFNTPEKAKRALVLMVLAPAFLGFLNTLLCPDDDDDEKEVMDYYRDNYIVFGPVKIPITQELRPFWRIGVNCALGMQGRRTGGEMAQSIISGFTEHLIPIPPALSETATGFVNGIGERGVAGGIGQGVVSGVVNTVFPQYADGVKELISNKDFMGNEIVKNYDWSDMPQYTANKSEAELYKDIAYAFYVLGGGDTKHPSRYKSEGIGNEIAFDWSPKVVHKALGVVGSTGALQFLCMIYGLTKAAVRSDVDVQDVVRGKDIPLWGTFVRPEEKSMYRHSIYKEANDLAKSYKLQLKGYNDAIKKASDAEAAQLTQELDAWVAEQEKRGFNIDEVQKMLDAYKASNAYNVSIKLGQKEEDIQKAHPEWEEQQKRSVQAMNEMLMEYNGIEHHITAIEEAMGHKLPEKPKQQSPQRESQISRVKPQKVKLR